MPLYLCNILLSQFIFNVYAQLCVDIMLYGKATMIYHNWASSWDYGTYRIDDQRRLSRRPAKAQYATSDGSGETTHPRSITRAYAVRTHEVWKKTKGPTKNQISGPTRWLRMRVWKMSLRRTKSVLISLDDSIYSWHWEEEKTNDTLWLSWSINVSIQFYVVLLTIAQHRINLR